MNSAPLTYTGAAVSRLAYMAMMGAMTPKMRFAVAAMALPVPRSLVGKTVIFRKEWLVDMLHVWCESGWSECTFGGVCV